MENAYYNDRQQEISDDMETAMYDWTQQWVNENPEPKKAATEQYNQRFRNEHEAYRQQILPEVENRKPLALRPYDTPQIIRATQMGLHCPDQSKFPDEVDKVMMHPVELYDGEMAVHEIFKKYDFGRIMPYITAVVKNDNEALMLEAIGLTNELLSAWQYERSEDRIAAQQEAQYRPRCEAVLVKAVLGDNQRHVRRETAERARRSLHVALSSECQLGSVCSLRARVVR